LKTYALTADSLFVSSDNGATWTDMTSSIPAGIVINNLAVSDSNTDVAIGLCKANTVIYTLDAGVTWSYVTTGTFVTLSLTEEWTVGQIISFDGYIEAILSTASGIIARYSSGNLDIIGNVRNPVYSLYFDGTSGIAGTDGKIFASIDSGSTWAALNGGEVLYGEEGYPGKIFGLYLNKANGWIVAAGENGTWRSGDFGVTFIKTFSLQSTDLAFDKRRPMDMWVSGSRGTLARSSNNGASWDIVRGNSMMEGALPITAISTTNGSTVLFSEGLLLSQWFEGTERALLNGNIVSHIIAAPDPGVVNCFTLTDCDGIQAPFYTDEDLSAYVGAVVSFQEVTGPGPTLVDHPGCWQVTPSFFNCIGSIGYIPDVIITNSLRSCSDCKSKVCYLLTNCENQIQNVVTNALLALFVGKIIKICKVEEGVVNCQCWSVEIAETGCSFAHDIEFNGVDLYYDTIPKEDCDCCLDTPAPDPIVPPYQQVRYTLAKDFSQSTMTSCEVTAATSYANLMERTMMWKRLGIMSVKPPLIQMAVSEIRFRLAEFGRFPTSGECNDETPCGCC